MSDRAAIRVFETLIKRAPILVVRCQHAVARYSGDEATKSCVRLERSTLIRRVVAANHLDALVAEKLLQVKDRRPNVDGTCREGVAQLVSVDIDAAALAQALHQLLHARDRERQRPRSNLLSDAEEDLASWAGPLWVALGGDVPLEPPGEAARLRGAATVRGEQRHGSVTAALGEVGAVGGPLHHHERRSVPYVEVVDAERHELAHPHAGREQGLDDEPVAGTLAGVEHAPDVPGASASGLLYFAWRGLGMRSMPVSPIASYPGVPAQNRASARR